MEHKEINLTKKRIFSNETGVNYVEMLVPDNWQITINTNKDKYGGYTYPYTFRINLKSEDNTVALTYFSPRNYLDEHRMQFNDTQTDDYGNLLYHFVTIEEYLDEWAIRDLKDLNGFAHTGDIETKDAAKIEAERKNKAIEEAASKGCILSSYYYKPLIRSYAYRYKDTDRIRLYAGIIEAKGLRRNVPMPDNIPRGLLSEYMMQSVFPDAFYDQQTGQYYRTIMNETRWTARQLLTLDCMAKDYDYVYEQVFAPIRKQGITICDDIWQDYEQIRNKMNSELAKIREDKKEAARNAGKQRMDRNSRLYEDLRKTQKEIHDIQKSSYENTRKTQAKVREMWGDVNQGNTRFVDKDGNEHVIHTYDDYAYKSGDTYVTSDSPLDHDYDWEELKKKKY